MEELENSSDKGIYWIIFFIGLLIIGFLVHNFVFSYKNEEKDVREGSDEVEEFDIIDYIGIWQLFGESDIPEHELSIISVENNILTFDYYVKDIASFVKQEAKLDGNVAKFDMVDVDRNFFVSGKIIFRGNRVFLAIISSSFEDIVTGTIEFNIKGEENLLD